MQIGKLPSPLSSQEMQQWFSSVLSAKEIPLSAFKEDSTALVVVDMINGFAVSGALCSANTASIVPQVEQLMQACRRKGIPMVFFADSHSKDSPEFQSYPVHCLAGEEESRPVEVLEQVGGYTLIPKASTNGFLEPAFQQWLKEHPKVDQFIITGCCTDICVQQFALTVKTDFNRRCLPSRVVVPAELTATYDASGHPAALTELASYHNMATSGVEIVSHISID